MKIILSKHNNNPMTFTGDANTWGNGVYADGIFPAVPKIAVWNGVARRIDEWACMDICRTYALTCNYIRIPGYTGEIESITMKVED